jgi:hypothetical protein
VVYDKMMLLPFHNEYPFLYMQRKRLKRQSVGLYSVIMDAQQLHNKSSVTEVTNIPAGLRPIHTLLTSHGWLPPSETRYHVATGRLTRTTSVPSTTTEPPSHSSPKYTCELTYVKDPSSDDEFRVRTTKDKVTVAVPIANAPYLYASSFKNYFAATEFVEKHLATYEKKMTSTLN